MRLDESNFYSLCERQAMQSPCQKMHFGCIIARVGRVIYSSFNKTIPELRSICEPRCIRLSLASRSEPMLGACGHAEEVIWQAIHEGTDLRDCDLFVAGFFPNGEPWRRERTEHTCLRCALQMHHARVGRVWVAVGEHWQSLTTSEAIGTALAYAKRCTKLDRLLGGSTCDVT